MFDYELIDSGNLFKLERFGNYTVQRPSSVALWQPRKSLREWKDLASATFFPTNTWEKKKTAREQWQLNISEDLTISVRLQKNGQIGLFPEHYSYLNKIADWSFNFREQYGRAPNVLNLFAYTGLASLFLLHLGCKVTHVEIQSTVLKWFQENLALNNLSGAKNLRIINEDAYAFVRRENKRGKTYDLIIADPPSFSRLSSGKAVKLTELASTFITDIAQLTSKKIIFTAHDTTLPAETVLSVAYGVRMASDIEYKIDRLFLKESSSSDDLYQREISCGYLLNIKVKKS
jgi:23S rRNA (cytosine1962-C5)-methyltransferase